MQRLFSDTIYFKNGSVMDDVEIEYDDGTKVWINVSGAKMQFNKKEILKVEKNKTSPKETSEGKIGQWRGNPSYADAIYTFWKINDKIIMRRDFKDGSNSEKEMIQKKDQSGRLRFEEKGGNDFGEYYVIEKNGYLGHYDNEGLIYTMPPITKEALEEEQIAKGLVKYQNKWFTPEEKYELEQKSKGLIKHGDKWLTYDEAQRAKGLVKYQKRWVTPEQKWEIIYEHILFPWIVGLSIIIFLISVIWLLYKYHSPEELQGVAFAAVIVSIILVIVILALVPKGCKRDEAEYLERKREEEQKQEARRKYDEAQWILQKMLEDERKYPFE